MKTTTITTKRPCCGRTSRFQAITDVPRETYTCRCRLCETTWDVERRMLTNREGIRIDWLVWTDMQSGEYVRTYGE